jgi:hypothetical protein
MAYFVVESREQDMFSSMNKDAMSWDSFLQGSFQFPYRMYLFAQYAG